MNNNLVIAIPIFTDQQQHFNHSNNHLSLLYIKELSKDSQMLMFNHHDTIDVDNLDVLKDKTILTPNKKQLLSIYPAKTIYDINLLHWYLYNKPLDLENIRVNAIDILSNRYYNKKDINTIIPVYKHQEKCDMIASLIEQTWSERDKIDFESYEKYNKDAPLAFYSIERNGIPVNADKVFDILGNRTKQHLSNNKLFSDYFLYTTTGRPSNSFGGINFAALDENKRKAIVPENDMLVEYDYDAFHVRILADLIDYDLPKESAHDYLAQFYGKNISYEESKNLTFKYLYGRIPIEIDQLHPFFGKVRDLINILWNEYKAKGYIETPIYKRKILASNFENMNKNKLLNYMIQATETEYNINTIIELQRYLYKKKTRLILYVYDSFLIDYSEEDGDQLLNDIQDILEQTKYMVRIQKGKNYGF